MPAARPRAVAILRCRMTTVPRAPRPPAVGRPRRPTLIAGLLGVVSVALAAFLLLFVPGYDRLIEMGSVEWRDDAIATYSHMTAPRLDTADDTQVSPTASNPVGVNTFLEQEPDPAARRRSMQLIHDAGVAWVRQEFPWKDIEQQGRGNFTDRKFVTSTWDK